MRSRFVWWRQGDPSFGDEFMDPMGTRPTHGEWLMVTNRQAFRPPFDVYETDEHIVIKVEIAGMREEDFAIALDGRVLQISGARGDAEGKLAYQRMEINYGEFCLDVRLPHAVNQGAIEASYERGFLSVSIPRRPSQRRIPVIETNEEG